MQDGGGGRKEKMSLGTIQNEFAMRFSVNQGFHCGWPEMSSLVFYSASTKVVPKKCFLTSSNVERDQRRIYNEDRIGEDAIAASFMSQAKDHLGPIFP